MKAYSSMEKAKNFKIKRFLLLGRGENGFDVFLLSLICFTFSFGG